MLIQELSISTHCFVLVCTCTLYPGVHHYYWSLMNGKMRPDGPEEARYDYER